MKKTRALWAFLGGCAILAVGYGLRQSFGLFIGPMEVARAWPAGVFAFTFALQNLVWGVAQPFAGACVDRYGPRATLIAGAFAFAGGIAVLARAPTPFTFVLGSGILLGIALAATWIGALVGPISALVPPQRRASAIGVLGAGGSVGQLLYPPFTQFAIAHVGWQATFGILGTVALGIVPFAFLLGRGPVKSPHDSALPLGRALREALCVPSYGLLTAGFFVCGFHLAFFQTHLPAIVARAGLSPSISAAALGIVGAFNIAGTYASGRLSDRFPKRYVLSGIYGLRALAMVAFVLVPVTAFSVIAFSAALGILWLSTVSPTSGIIGEKFGLTWVSTLFGITFLSHQLGAFCGAWLGGVIVDRTGSYADMWMISIVLALVGVAIQLPIDERPVSRLRVAQIA